MAVSQIFGIPQRFWITVIGLPLALMSLYLWVPFYEPTLTIRATSLAAEPSTGVSGLFSVEKTGILNAHSLKFHCYYASVKTVGLASITINDMLILLKKNTPSPG